MVALVSPSEVGTPRLVTSGGGFPATMPRDDETGSGSVTAPMASDPPALVVVPGDDRGAALTISTADDSGTPGTEDLTIGSTDRDLFHFSDTGGEPGGSDDTHSMNPPQVRVVARSRGRVVVWLGGCVVVRLCDCVVVVVWLCGCVVVRLCGCVVVWLRGRAVAWLCGCVVAWLCGCVVVWLCGCVVVWSCGFVVIFSCVCGGML